MTINNLCYQIVGVYELIVHREGKDKVSVRHIVGTQIPFLNKEAKLIVYRPLFIQHQLDRHITSKD